MLGNQFEKGTNLILKIHIEHKQKISILKHE